MRGKHSPEPSDQEMPHRALLLDAQSEGLHRFIDPRVFRRVVRALDAAAAAAVQIPELLDRVVWQQKLGSIRRGQASADLHDSCP